MVLAMVQSALWAHAGAIAQAAADHGVEVAAALGAQDGDGVAAAEGFIRNAGSLDDVAIVATNAPDTSLVQLTVTGTYPTVFGSRTVTATAVTIRERVPDS